MPQYSITYAQDSSVNKAETMLDVYVRSYAARQAVLGQRFGKAPNVRSITSGQKEAELSLGLRLPQRRMEIGTTRDPKTNCYFVRTSTLEALSKSCSGIYCNLA